MTRFSRYGYGFHPCERHQRHATAVYQRGVADRGGRDGRFQFPGNAHPDRDGSRRGRDQQIPVQGTNEGLARGP